MLKKEAKRLADNLADSTFWGLADVVADAGGLIFVELKSAMKSTTYIASLLADKLADSWRDIIRQSATPFRVADSGGCGGWPMPKGSEKEVQMSRALVAVTTG